MKSDARQDTDTRSKALSISIATLRFDFIYQLNFMRLLLKQTNNLIACLQAKNLDILAATRLMEACLKLFADITDTDIERHNEVSVILIRNILSDPNAECNHLYDYNPEINFKLPPHTTLYSSRI
ncbi:hypothetical protein QYM36_004479 [Artemia franciscana]|uniref:Uncharacterized protein n=1 Tax=Artemia franciscana TaxID=6661 RepID=A0AA88I325_ARTSF|nr:hypothetical protein QYM36_004479 [Artemia franciscana]